MNQHAGPAPLRSTDMDQPGSPNNDAGIRSFATLNTEPDDEDADASTATGLNPGPDYEKSGGAIELLTPDDGSDDDDDDALTSEDADDDRV